MIEKVYVVVGGWDCEDSEVIGVFSTACKAQKAVYDNEKMFDFVFYHEWKVE